METLQNYVDADIQIYNLNEAPIFTSTSWSVEENQTNGGDLTNYLIEPDNGTGALNGTYSFSISGGDAASLSVNSSTGLLTFNTAPDYETKSSYTFEVTIVDSTFYPTNATTTQTVQINITDGLDQAAFGCAQYNDPCIYTEPENGDAYMFHHYVLQDGNNTSNLGSFGCDPCNGFVVQSGGAVNWGSASNDYETAPNQTYTATWDNPNDSWPMIYQVVNVNLTDVADENAPVFTSGSTYYALENQTAIGTVTATDADGDAITYTFNNYEVNDPISIDPTSGVLTFNSAPDYETKNQYGGAVTASSGDKSTTMTILVNVVDIANENAPVFTSSDTFSAAENQTAIGTVTATDADGDAVTYSMQQILIMRILNMITMI